MSVQRMREQLAIIHIGKEIREQNIEETGVTITKSNPRTGIRLECIHPKFENGKVSRTAEKSFGPWAAKLFNSLPPKIKLEVQNKDTFNASVKKLCKDLDDFPFLGPHQENSIVTRIRSIKY